MNVVYKNYLFNPKNSQLRLILKQISFTAHWKCRSAEMQKLVVSMPMRLAKVSQKEGWTTHY
jgi:hypothetical protein